MSAPGVVQSCAVSNHCRNQHGHHHEYCVPKFIPRIFRLFSLKQLSGQVCALCEKSTNIDFTQSKNRLSF